MKKIMLNVIPFIWTALLVLIGTTAYSGEFAESGTTRLSGDEPKHLRLASLAAFHTSIEASPEGEKYLAMPGPAWVEVTRRLKEANLKEVFDNEPDQAELTVSLHSEKELGQEVLLLVVTVTKFVPSEIQIIKGPLPADIWVGRKVIFKKTMGTYDAKSTLLKLVDELISDRKNAIENLRKLSEAFKKTK